MLSVFEFSETAGRSEVIPTFGPSPVGELQIPLNLLADRTSAVIAVAVAIVGLAVQVFSIWYLRDDPRYPVFATTVSLFLAAMLLVVQSDDLVLTLVGWEVMGWCSYLLIGHVSARESARRAAYKAFMVTRVADIGFVLGLVILAVGAGSTEIGTVIAHWTVGSGSATAALVTGSPVLTAALVLLLAGVAGKSGLIPFHDWLPDAMEGPTPASALIHAATMVAAGTYVVARLHPLYAVDDTARIVLGVLAGLTMVWAALARLRPDRHQADAGLLHAQPDRRHGQRARVRPRAERGAGARPSGTCSPTRSSSRCSSSRSAGCRCSPAVPRSSPCVAGPRGGARCTGPSPSVWPRSPGCRRWWGSSPRRASSSPPRSR